MPEEETVPVDYHDQTNRMLIGVVVMICAVAVAGGTIKYGPNSWQTTLAVVNLLFVIAIAVYKSVFETEAQS